MWVLLSSSTSLAARAGRAAHRVLRGRLLAVTQAGGPLATGASCFGGADAASAVAAAAGLWDSRHGGVGLM